ncbi:hypothetical protein QOT17_002344 [Balamuthia mandrillaris]
MEFQRGQSQISVKGKSEKVSLNVRALLSEGKKKLDPSGRVQFKHGFIVGACEDGTTFCINVFDSQGSKEKPIKFYGNKERATCFKFKAPYLVSFHQDWTVQIVNVVTDARQTLKIPPAQYEIANNDENNTFSTRGRIRFPQTVQFHSHVLAVASPDKLFLWSHDKMVFNEAAKEAPIVTLPVKVPQGLKEKFCSLDGTNNVLLLGGADEFQVWDLEKLRLLSVGSVSKGAQSFFQLKMRDDTVIATTFDTLAIWNIFMPVNTKVGAHIHASSDANSNHANNNNNCNAAAIKKAPVTQPPTLVVREKVIPEVKDLPNPNILETRSTICSLFVDDQYIITGTIDGRVSLYVRQTGQLLREIDIYQEEIHQLSSSPSSSSPSSDSLSSSSPSDMKNKVNSLRRWGEWLFCGSANQQLSVWPRHVPPSSSFKSIRVLPFKEEISNLFIDVEQGKIVLIMKPGKETKESKKKDKDSSSSSSGSGPATTFRIVNPKLEGLPVTTLKGKAYSELDGSLDHKLLVLRAGNYEVLMMLTHSEKLKDLAAEMTPNLENVHKSLQELLTARKNRSAWQNIVAEAHYIDDLYITLKELRAKLDSLKSMTKLSRMLGSVSLRSSLEMLNSGIHSNFQNFIASLRVYTLQNKWEEAATPGKQGAAPVAPLLRKQTVIVPPILTRQTPVVIAEKIATSSPKTDNRKKGSSSSPSSPLSASGPAVNLSDILNRRASLASPLSDAKSLTMTAAIGRSFAANVAAASASAGGANNNMKSPRGGSSRSPRPMSTALERTPSASSLIPPTVPPRNYHSLQGIKEEAALRQKEREREKEEKEKEMEEEKRAQALKTLEEELEREIQQQQPKEETATSPTWLPKKDYSRRGTFGDTDKPLFVSAGIASDTEQTSSPSTPPMRRPPLPPKRGSTITLSAERVHPIRQPSSNTAYTELYGEEGEVLLKRAEGIEEEEDVYEGMPQYRQQQEQQPQPTMSVIDNNNANKYGALPMTEYIIMTPQPSSSPPQSPLMDEDEDIYQSYTLGSVYRAIRQEETTAFAYLWTTHFGTLAMVPWSEFIITLREKVNLSISSADERLLAHIMDTYGTGFVSKHKCKEWLKGFGPVERAVDNTRKILQEPWFHGWLSRTETDLLLGSEKAGTFLVRFSESSPGDFTVGFIMKDKDHKLDVRQILITTDENEELRFKVKQPDRSFKHFASLHDVVAAYKRFLRRPYLSHLLQYEWFHGDLTSSETEELFANQKEGTFLLRFGRRSPYASSFVGQGGVVCHTSIMITTDGFYQPVGEERRFSSLEELVRSYPSVLRVPYLCSRAALYRLKQQSS